MADTWPVKNGAIGTQGSAERVDTRAAGATSRGAESSAAKTGRAYYPFIHPDDKSSQFNGIWTFKSQKQLDRFIFDEITPFEKPGSRPDWDAVGVRVNNSGGQIYFVLLNKNELTWVQYTIPGIQSIDIKVNEEVKALNNIVREAPLLFTETEISRGNSTTKDQIPNTTTEAGKVATVKKADAANTTYIADETTKYKIEDGKRVYDDPEAAKKKIPPETALDDGTKASGPTTSQGYTQSTANGSGPTELVDILGNIIGHPVDTFLQGGLPGSLSQILGGVASSLLGQLGGVMNNLLSTTGLTSTLGNVFGQVSSALGSAIGDVAGALTGAAGELFNGLGNVISEIPGMAPVVRDFSSAVKGLSSGISTAYSGLDPLLKTGVDAALGYGTAKLLNKVGLPSIQPKLAAQIAGAISFGSNPALGFANVADTSRAMDKKIYSITGNSTFGNLAAKCQIAANEMEKCITSNSFGKFGIANTPINLVDEVRAITAGSVSDIIPSTARLFDGTLFSNEIVKRINGKSYVLQR